MKLCGPLGYPDDWDSTCLWDGKLSAHFGYPSSGWVLLSLLTTAYNGSLTIHLSDFYDPFWNLVDWLKAIADDDLPASFKIDEEGCYKDLIVRRYHGRFPTNADVEFRVNGDYWDEESNERKEGCFFLTRARRAQLLHEFIRRLDQWLREDYDADGWNRSWREEEPDNPFTDLKNLDIEGLRAKLRG